jgi:hypothetical protein
LALAISLIVLSSVTTEPGLFPIWNFNWPFYFSMAFDDPMLFSLCYMLRTRASTYRML